MTGPRLTRSFMFVPWSMRIRIVGRCFFFFQAEDGIRDGHVTGVQTCALPISLGLSFHSFLDGLAIGVGFEAGPKVGFIVLLAVVAHDFADGLNTVTFMLATRNSRWRTFLLLAVDALAPVAGALCAGLFRITPYHLAFQLSFFAGFLLYLGASDLLPQVHERPRFALLASTIGGLATAGIVVYALQSRA